MKSCLFLVALFLTTQVAFCQLAKTPLYSIENDVVMAKCEFVSQLKNKPYSDITPYTTVSTLSFQSLNGLNNYMVTFNRYKGWDGEAGDFQSVEIKANNQKILQLDNQDGWVTLPSPLCPVDGVNLYYEQLDSTTTLVYLTGFAYNSNPGYLTLILLRKGLATVVFNKPYAVSSVQRVNGIFTINLKDGFDEYIAGSSSSPTEPINKPLSFQITWENGNTLPQLLVSATMTDKYKSHF